MTFLASFTKAITFKLTSGLNLIKQINNTNQLTQTKATVLEFFTVYSCEFMLYKLNYHHINI